MTVSTVIADRPSVPVPPGIFDPIQAEHRRRSVPLLLDAGEEIYSPGQRSDRLYRVKSGAVRIYRLLANGRRQISAFHFPGEIFGFDTDSTHHFFADAILDTELEIFLLTNNAGFDKAMMESALRCLVRSQEHLLVVGRQVAMERVAAFLIDMIKRQGRPDRVDLPMSRADIADYLGLTIETVSRIFTKLRMQGLIGLDEIRKVRILKMNALQVLAD